jgi:hypothetical protein
MEHEIRTSGEGECTMMETIWYRILCLSGDRGVTAKSPQQAQYNASLDALPWTEARYRRSVHTRLLELEAVS